MYLTALVKSKPGQAEALKELLLELVAGSTAEATCLQYDLHQSAEDENQFIFHEEWASAAALEVHNVQPHILKFREKSGDLIDGEIVVHRTKLLAGPRRSD